jgi:hypothetical protein
MKWMLGMYPTSDTGVKYFRRRLKDIFQGDGQTVFLGGQLGNLCLFIFVFY